MINRLSLAALLLLLICPACFGQTSFQGLTPGQSTRADVERVLGPPIRENSPTEYGLIVFQYKPPPGTAAVEVRYNDGSAFAEQMHVSFLKPIARSALIKTFSLPQQAEATYINEVGKLVEFFSGQALLIFGHASGEADSGITSLGYYSQESFSRVLHWELKRHDVPSLNANVVTLRFYPDNAQGVAGDHPDKRVCQRPLRFRSRPHSAQLWR